MSFLGAKVLQDLVIITIQTSNKPHSLDLSIEPKIGLILGFEGALKFRIKW